MKTKVEVRFIEATPSDRDPLAQRHTLALKVDFEREEEIERDLHEGPDALGDRIHEVLLTTCNALFMSTWRSAMLQLNGAPGLPRFHWADPPSPVLGLTHRAEIAEKDRDEWKRRAKEAEARLDELRRTFHPPKMLSASALSEAMKQPHHYRYVGAGRVDKYPFEIVGREEGQE